MRDPNQVKQEICQALGLDPSRPPINLTPDQTSEVTGAAKPTLATWRSTGRYNLPFVKNGKRVAYPLTAVAEYIANRTMTHTGG